MDADELPTDEPTLEDVKMRQAELRRARQLLQRAQEKARRVHKIKSKTYRKLRRKERDANAKDAEELLDGADQEELRLQREVDRAKERASLRHKNGSKWAIGAKNTNDRSKQSDMADMLKRSEDLRRKIGGPVDSEEESGSEEEDEAAIKRRAFDELNHIAEESKAEEQQPAPKGVMGMKFMQDAMERQMREVDREVDDFQRQLGGDVVAGSDSEEQVMVTGPIRVGGRFILQGNPSSVSNSKEDPQPPAHQLLQSLQLPMDVERPSIAEIKQASGGAPSKTSFTHRSPLATYDSAAQSASSSAANPWLTVASESMKVTKKNTDVSLHKGSTAVIKSVASLKKDLSRSNGVNSTEVNDATVEISLDAALVAKSSSSAPPAKSEASQPTKAKVAKKTTRPGLCSFYIV